MVNVWKNNCCIFIGQLDVDIIKCVLNINHKRELLLQFRLPVFEKISFRKMLKM